MIAKLMKYIVRVLLNKSWILSHNAKIFVPSDIPLRFKLNIYCDRYEAAEIAACKKYANEDTKTILEIGGGVGVLSKVLNEHFKPVQHAIYEPIESNCKNIEKQKLKYGVELHNHAVTLDKSEELTFFQKRAVFGSGFILNDEERGGSGKTKPVSTVSLDELTFSSCDLVVMDVEGYEEKLLPALQQKCPEAVIVFEYHQTKVSKPFNEFIKSLSGQLMHHAGNVFVLLPETK